MIKLLVALIKTILASLLFLKSRQIRSFVLRDVRLGGRFTRVQAPTTFKFPQQPEVHIDEMVLRAADILIAEENYPMQRVTSQTSGPSPSQRVKLISQSLDYTTMSLLAKELKQLVVPAKVENIIQDDAYNLYIECKTGASGPLWLHVCWHPDYAHIGIEAPPQRIDGNVFSLASTLRGLLKQQTIVNVQILSNWDRIIAIDFNDRLESHSSQPPTSNKRLLLEVMGARSNVLLISLPENEILACGYQVSAASSTRPLQTGSVYSVPPISLGAGLFDPAEFFCSKATTNSNNNKGVVELCDALLGAGGGDQSIDKALVKCFKGISPNIAKLMSSKISEQSRVAAMDQSTALPLTVNDLLSNKAAALYLDNTLRLWISTIGFTSAPCAENSGGQDLRCVVEPSHILTPEGQSLFVPIQFKHNHQNNDSSDSTMKTTHAPLLLFVTSYFTRRQRQDRFAVLQRSCTRKLQSLQKKASKFLDGFTEQLEEARGGKADQLKYTGDLITSYLYAHVPGAKSLKCIDFESGEEVEISIPQGSTPALHAQSLYKKAKKLKRSVEVLESLFGKASAVVNYLDDIDSSLRNIETCESYNDVIALREIDQELDDIGANSVLYFGHASNSATNEPNSSTNKQQPLLKDKPSNAKKGEYNKSKANKSTKQGSNRSQQSAAPIAAGKKKKMNTNYDDLLVLDNIQLSTPDNREITGEPEKMPRLIVGRNSKQNERVTFEIAKDHQLWFHVQGCPGSHCLLQLEVGEVASERSLQVAADVAAFYSKARGSTQVPVMYAMSKHVKRISGAPLGTVSVMQQMGVIYGRPDRGLVWSSKYSS